MPPKFLSARFSPRRVATVCAGVFLVVLFLLLLDKLVVAVPYSRDFDVTWAPDGSSLVFARYQQYDSRARSHWEIWRADAGGAQARCLYRACPEFALNSFRSLSCTPDGRSVVLRLNKAGAVIDDYLIAVPTASRGVSDTWRLTKAHRYDVFLAASSGMAALRKYEITRSGAVRNTVEFRTFPGRRLVRSHTFGKRRECLAVCFSGDGRRACAVVVEVGARGGQRCELQVLDLKTGAVESTTPMSSYPAAFGFLSGRRFYVQGLEGSNEYVSIVGAGGKGENIFAAPATEGGVGCHAVQGKDVLVITRENLLFAYDLEHRTMRRFPVFKELIYQASLNPDGRTVLLSDVSSLMRFDLRDGLATKMACLDFAGAVGRNPAFACLRDARGRAIWGLFKALYPEEAGRAEHRRP